MQVQELEKQIGRVQSFGSKCQAAAAQAEAVHSFARHKSEQLAWPTEPPVAHCNDTQRLGSQSDPINAAYLISRAHITASAGPAGRDSEQQPKGPLHEYCTMAKGSTLLAQLLPIVQPQAQEGIDASQAAVEVSLQSSESKQTRVAAAKRVFSYGPRTGKAADAQPGTAVAMQSADSVSEEEPVSDGSMANCLTSTTHPAVSNCREPFADRLNLELKGLLPEDVRISPDDPSEHLLSCARAQKSPRRPRTGDGLRQEQAVGQKSRAVAKSGTHESLSNADAQPQSASLGPYAGSRRKPFSYGPRTPPASKAPVTLYGIAANSSSAYTRRYHAAPEAATAGQGSPTSSCKPSAYCPRGTALEHS